MSTVVTETVSGTDGLQQPDIGYEANYAKYVARTKRRLETEKLPTTLPPGFPEKLDSSLVWEGKDIEKSYNWVYKLDPEELQELHEALEHFLALNIPLGYITQATFPLPKLGHTLREISREIHFGHGFKIIRGFPVSKYSQRDNVIIFTGLSSYVASIRGRQDRKFDGKPADMVLAHIKDLTDTSEGNIIGSPSATAEDQAFHTDAGDVISLLVLGTSAEGGQSKLASFGKIYNDIAQSRPDLIWTMLEDWAFELYGNPSKRYDSRPPLYYVSGKDDSDKKLIIQYARRLFTGYKSLPRSTDIPPLTEAQAEAIDAIHYKAEEYALTLDFCEGDIQLVNNLALLHGRTGFKDSPTQTRHLLRLWLRDAEYGWPTPEPLREAWARLYGNLNPAASVFPLEPQMRKGVDGNHKPETLEK